MRASDQEIARYGEPSESRPSPPSTSGRCAGCSALFASDADAGDALVRASAALGAAVPAHAISGDCRRRLGAQDAGSSSSRCSVAPGLWVVPSWCEPVDANAINLEARSRPGVRHRKPSDDAHVPALAGAAPCAVARRCSITAAGPASWPSLRPSSARPQLPAPTSICRRSPPVATTRSATVSPRSFDLPEAFEAGTLRRRRREHSGQPAATAGAAARSACTRRADASFCRAYLESQAAAVMAAYERWFTIGVWSSEEGWVALAGSRIDDDG